MLNNQSAHPVKLDEDDFLFIRSMRSMGSYVFLAVLMIMMLVSVPASTLILFGLCYEPGLANSEVILPAAILFILAVASSSGVFFFIDGIWNGKFHFLHITHDQMTWGYTGKEKTLPLKDISKVNLSDNDGNWMWLEMKNGKTHAINNEPCLGEMKSLYEKLYAEGVRVSFNDSYNYKK